MFQPQINTFKQKIGNPSQSLGAVNKILDGKSIDLKEKVSSTDKMSADTVRELFEELIRLQYALLDKDTRELSRVAGVSKDDMLALAELAVDFARAKKEYSVMYGLVNQYLLDTKRHNESVLAYAFSLIKVKEFSQAELILKKHKKQISAVYRKEYGNEYFHEAMTFDKDTAMRRDYEIPVKVAELFQLDKNTTENTANAQHDYNVNHKKYLIAADIALQFHLPPVKLFNAAVQAFTLKFDKFGHQLFAGEYSEQVELAQTDPYSTSVAVVQKYGLLNAAYKKNGEIQSALRTLKHVAATVLRKLANDEESPEVAMGARVFFMTRIIADFDLMDKDNLQLRQECMKWTRDLIYQIDGRLETVRDALQYHDAVVKIYESNQDLQKEIRQVAAHMFDLYCTHGRYTSLRETLDTFALALDEIFLPIKKKTLEILDKKDYDTFEKFLNIFTGHDILGRLRNDQDFLSKIYSSYQHAVYGGDFDFALKLCDVFKFSAQRRIEPVRSRISELLNTSKDQEAYRLMSKFKVKAGHFSTLMLDQYIKRTATSVRDASEFRQKFGVGISDIGFMRWFFTEMLPIPFLR